MTDSLERLFRAVQALDKGDPASRTARLMRAGRSKIAKKLAEEAAEVVIDAVRGDREATVRESADLLYHLVVLWADAGIRPQDVWAEMDHREKTLGLAEKRPKNRAVKAAMTEPLPRRKVVALHTHRIPKRRSTG